MPLSTNKRPMSEAAWNRCDICGRFISMADFPDKATRHLLTPDSDRSEEKYETYHNSCFANWRKEHPIWSPAR